MPPKSKDASGFEVVTNVGKHAYQNGRFKKKNLLNIKPKDPKLMLLSTIN